MTAMVPPLRLRRRGDEESREHGESRRGQQSEFPLEFLVVFHGLPPVTGCTARSEPTAPAAHRVRA